MIFYVRSKSLNFYQNFLRTWLPCAWKVLFISGTEIIKKKITGTRSSLGTTASCYKVDVERVLWSFAISWSIQGWKRPFWTSILSEVRAIYYSSIQWTICALNWTWRSFPKDRVYIDVSCPCNSRSLHSWNPENTFKGGIHSLTLDRNGIAIYIYSALIIKSFWLWFHDELCSRKEFSPFSDP